MPLVIRPHTSSLKVNVISWVLRETWHLPACTAQGERPLTSHHLSLRNLLHPVPPSHMLSPTAEERVTSHYPLSPAPHILSFPFFHSHALIHIHTRARRGRKTQDADANKEQTKRKTQRHIDAQIHLCDDAHKTQRHMTQHPRHTTHTLTRPHFMGSLYARLHVCV